MRVRRASIARLVFIPLAWVVVLGGWGSGAQVEARSTTPNLSGTWALEGTGPAGLVNVGGRIGTLHLHQHAHALTFTLASGRHHYVGTGTVQGSPSRLRMVWRMPGVGSVQFTGTAQNGGRILGQWSDTQGDDGGALLVRLGR